jgi:hypothetical protein
MRLRNVIYIGFSLVLASLAYYLGIFVEFRGMISFTMIGL